MSEDNRLNAPNPVYLSSYGCATSDADKGYFRWVLDQPLTAKDVDTDMYVQLYNFQIARCFPNVYGDGRVLTFYLGAASSVLYTITIPQDYYATADSIATTINAVRDYYRVSDNFQVTLANTIIGFVNPASANRKINVYSMTGQNVTILPTGLATRMGITGTSLFVPSAANTVGTAIPTSGTYDLLFPKNLMIACPNSLMIDLGIDAVSNQNLKVLASIPINVNFGDAIDFQYPYIQQSITNNSVNMIDIGFYDESFNELPFYNAFVLTLMFYR